MASMMFRPHRPRHRIAALAVGGLLVLAACGSDEPSDGVLAPEETGQADEASDAVQENGPVVVTGDALDLFAGVDGDTAIGATAPLVEGESFDASPVSIGGPSGSASLVVFLAHWCPHCNDEIPELITLEESGALPDGLDVVGVSTAVDPSQPNYPPSAWIAENGWPWPMMADDTELTAMGAFGGTSFPYTVVLDADGDVLGRRAGSASAAEIANWLSGLLA